MRNSTYGTAFLACAVLAAFAATLLGYVAGQDTINRWDLLVPAFGISLAAGAFTLCGLRLRRTPDETPAKPAVDPHRKWCRID